MCVFSLFLTCARGRDAHPKALPLVPSGRPPSDSVAMATVCLLVLSTLLPVGAARVGSTLAPAGRVLPASSRTPTFLFPATTRQHEHRRQQRNVPHTATTPRARPGARRDRAGLSSGVGSESELVGAAGSGVEDRTWKWRGYDIRYKVAGEVGGGDDSDQAFLVARTCKVFRFARKLNTAPADLESRPRVPQMVGLGLGLGLGLELGLGSGLGSGWSGQRNRRFMRTCK